jgi:hypothetical protein
VRIRDVLEKRRRILVAAEVGGLLVLGLGMYLSVAFATRWLRYLALAAFFAPVPLSFLWLRCPRCRRSIEFARVSPRKPVRAFEIGELCPHCGVSLEESWDPGA